MIKLSNGNQITWVVASGAFGFDGRGWMWEKPLFWTNIIDPSVFTITLKTITYQPRKQNGIIPIRFIKDGVVNAVGLKNPGVVGWYEKYFPRLNPNYRYILSVAHEHDLKYTINFLKERNVFNKFDAIEFNISCPNTVKPSIEDIYDNIEYLKKSELPIILKIGAHSYKSKQILNDNRDIIEAVSINSVEWDKFVLHTSGWKKNLKFPLSPLHHLGGGGVSGKIVYNINKQVAVSVLQLGAPVIGASAWDAYYVYELITLGCGAISFGSVFMRKPWWPNKIVKSLPKF